MSKIILEDFNGGDGYYKINLAYLNKEQIKEVEALVSKWNPVEETENERIKKEIIEYIKTGTYHKKWIAWLEKQGEQTNLPRFTFGDVLALQCCMETAKKVQEDKELYEVLSILHDKVYDAYHLENQSEKKSADKVEPKFKVGDWLVENEPNNYARFIQILEVVNVYGKERYKISRDIHNDEDVVECRFIENNYHPFTIQDAKEGDVLTDNLDCFNNPFIFILKRFENVYFGLVKPSDFSSHCFLTMSDKQEFREGDYHHMHNIQPATKEQRELLFSKMKEEGWEWDAEKKKLRKINSKWTSEDEQHLIVCENALRKYQVSDRWDADIIIKWLEDKLKQGEQKPKWTEEDEDMIESIIDYLKPMPIFFESTNGKSGKEYTKKFIKRSIKWLKSIEQRMKEC